MDLLELVPPAERIFEFCIHSKMVISEEAKLLLQNIFQRVIIFLHLMNRKPIAAARNTYTEHQYCIIYANKFFCIVSKVLANGNTLIYTVFQSVACLQFDE